MLSYWKVISFQDLLRRRPKARSGQIQFALRDHLSGMWQGRQVRMPNINWEQWRPILSHTTSLRQAHDMTYEYSLESLNFVAFTKPNKHKMRSKGFFLQLGRICFRILLRQSENFSDFYQVLSQFTFRNMIVPFYTSSSARPQAPLHLPHNVFDVKSFYKILPLLPIVIAKSR